MIIVFIFLGIILLGIILNKRGDYDIEVFGALGIVIGSMCLVIAIIWIIVAHVTAPKIIQENKINYDGLCKRYEIAASEYEDVSKSDVIADITAWNMMVYNTKYWTDSPWTNWFNPKEIADNLNYISLELEETE